MAMTSTPVFPQTLMNAAVQILPADTTTVKTIVTGAANGTKVEMLNVASTDTSARDLIFYLSDGTTNYQMTYLTVAASSGNSNTVIPVSLMTISLSSSPYMPFFHLPVDAMGNRYIYLKSGWSLKVNATTTVTTAKSISIVVSGGDF